MAIAAALPRRAYGPSDRRERQGPRHHRAHDHAFSVEFSKSNGAENRFDPFAVVSHASLEMQVEVRPGVAEIAGVAQRARAAPSKDH